MFAYLYSLSTQVRLLIEPTSARAIQRVPVERVRPSAEQVATLVARLRALMGESHVGSPGLVDSWKPGAFEMKPFAVADTPPSARSTRHSLSTAHSASSTSSHSALRTPHFALRRFRLPIPARVQLQEGRPIRVLTDRRGVNGGRVVQAAGPWRTVSSPHPIDQTTWDRDEWDVAVADGTVYRVYVEREAGQWFLEGVVD